MFVRVKNLWLSSFLEQGNINDSYVPAVPHCGKRLSAFKLFLFPQPRRLLSTTRSSGGLTQEAG